MDWSLAGPLPIPLMLLPLIKSAVSAGSGRCVLGPSDAARGEARLGEGWDRTRPEAS
jgi:hypothetical protein